MQTLKELKHDAVIAALDDCKTVTEAAQRLGMARSSLYAYLKTHPINRSLNQAKSLGKAKR